MFHDVNYGQEWITLALGIIQRSAFKLCFFLVIRIAPRMALVKKFLDYGYNVDSGLFFSSLFCVPSLYTQTYTTSK
jgi:hypothetical protein